jgi:hypothetical protein
VITVRLKADTTGITVRLKADTTGITVRLKADTTGITDGRRGSGERDRNAFPRERRR